MNICLVSAAYRPYPSGVSEHVHHLALALRDRGHRVAILTTRFAGEAEEPPGILVQRVGRALRIPLNRSFATLPVGLRLPVEVSQFLAEGDFDVVHCHGMFFPEIAYWALKASRSVNVITALMAGFRLYTAGSGLYRRLFAAHIRRIHGRIAISQRAKQAVEPYVPGDYRIIPSGVDTGRFRPDLEPLPPRVAGRSRILFVGRLDPRKGVHVLVEAMPIVLQHLPSAELVIVGDGPLRSQAVRTVERLGLIKSVSLVGAVPPADLPHYYAGADVYCSPALGGESLGIVLLEAMASGVPVVASAIPGYDETIRADIDGLLVTPGDARALAEAILRVLTEPTTTSRLREAGLRRAAEYAWPVLAERTEDYYRELFAQRRLAAGTTS